jgi:hypothetical protein
MMSSNRTTRPPGRRQAELGRSLDRAGIGSPRGQNGALLVQGQIGIVGNVARMLERLRGGSRASRSHSPSSLRNGAGGDFSSRCINSSHRRGVVNSPERPPGARRQMKLKKRRKISRAGLVDHGGGNASDARLDLLMEQNEAPTVFLPHEQKLAVPCLPARNCAR